MNGLPNIAYNPPKTLANKFIEKLEDVDGVRKIVLDPSMMANMVNGLPSDAMSLMQQIMSSNTTQENNTSSMQSEAMNLMKQMIGNQVVNENPNAGTEIIRKVPDILEKALHDTGSDSLDINIDASCVLGLFVNISKKDEVIERLKSISKVNYDNNIQESIFYYTDIGVTFFFNEENLLTEVEFTEKYREKTTKGLKIGDQMEKAIELYGLPRMKSGKGAIWNRFSIILHDRLNEIKLIRIKIRD